MLWASWQSNWRNVLFLAVPLAMQAACKSPEARSAKRPQAAVHSESQNGLTEAQRAADFDKLWTFVRDHYAFFPDKVVDWNRVREVHRPRALAAKSQRALLHVLEDTLDTLYDPHCMLNANAGDSWRPVPQEMWVEWIRDRAIVTAVRAATGAAIAGLRPGDEIVAVDGESIRDRAARRIPSALQKPDQAAKAWALLSAVAGRHDDAGIATIRRADGTTATLPTRSSETGKRPLVEGKRIGDVGYIRIASFADTAAVADFDEALNRLADTEALILDVRSNGGGDTAVARPIMGRLIATRTQYAWMARRDGDALGERWPEYVDPRGDTYAAPVFVVVDRFSVSMAEGVAMGLHGMGRARIVGTRMAGLGAAIGRVELQHLGVSAQISTEPVYHLDGTARWKFTPDVLVDPLSHDGSVPDPILDTARKLASGE